MGQQLGKVFSDTESRMGFLQERTAGNFKALLSWRRDCIVFPRSASRFLIQIKSPGSEQTIDTSQLIFIPAKTECQFTGKSVVSEFVALLPDQTLIQQLISENQLTKKDDDFLHARCFKLKRSRWIDDLIERYVFERVRNAASPVGCTFFLEKQMLNELARLVFTDKLQTHGETLGEEPADELTAALSFIENHLSEALDLERLSEHIQVDASTLRRLFKKSLNMTPGAYIKDRRLDEAAALIARGDYRISDVCALIGYEDLSSFTRSFKVRFGVTPGSYREKSAVGIHRSRIGSPNTF